MTKKEKNAFVNHIEWNYRMWKEAKETNPESRESQQWLSSYTALTCAYYGVTGEHYEH